MGRDITGMQTRFDLPEEPVNNPGVKGQFPVGQLPDMLLDRFSACWSLAATMPICAGIARQLYIRVTLANKQELKPLANVPGIRSLGNELSSEPLDKQKHLFPGGVDKHDVRKINN